MQSRSESAATTPASTGLVALELPPGAPPAVRPKPLASFVTQLLACRDHAPAYRARRRQEPQAALETYEEREAGRPAGHRFERVL